MSTYITNLDMVMTMGRCVFISPHYHTHVKDHILKGLLVAYVREYLSNGHVAFWELYITEADTCGCAPRMHMSEHEYYGGIFI